MWVVIALCILIALTILLLSIPVDLRLRVESFGKPILHLRLEWLFGRVGKSFRTGDAQRQPSRSTKKDKKSAEKEKKPGKKKRPSRDTGTLVWRIVRIPGLWQSLLCLKRRVYRSLTVRHLVVDFSAGLDDPADTALVVGPVSQVAMFADRWSPYSFRLTPVFRETAVLEGEGALDIRLYPIRVITPFIAFLVSPPVIRTVATLIGWRCRRK